MTVIPCLKNPRSFAKSFSFYVGSFQAPNKLVIKITKVLAAGRERDSAVPKLGAFFLVYTINLYKTLL